MTKKNTAPIKYATAIQRLEEIVKQIEEQDLDMDSLTNQVKEANELIRFCSETLNSVNQEVEKLLDEHKEEFQ